MISRLGALTALPAYLHISSYATLAQKCVMKPTRPKSNDIVSQARYDTSYNRFC